MYFKKWKRPTSHARVLRKVVSIMVACCLLTGYGCGGGFLGLEDYQRDLLFGVGSLALNLLGVPSGLLDLLNGDNGTGDGDGNGDIPPAGGDGTDGAFNCWDLNQNGTGDPDEDLNNDGVFDAFDCQGAPGPDGTQGEPGPAGEDGQDGAPGEPGEPGEPGAPGTDCWDLDGDGIADAGEDLNGDGVFDAQDCRGEDGEDGNRGSEGPQGPAGPEFFSVFIDDFFTVQTGSYDGLLELDADGPGGELVPVPIREPALGCVDITPTPEPQEVEVLAFRVAVPQLFHEGNPVSMRMYLWRTGEPDGDCFIFRLDAFRAAAGGGIGQYGLTSYVQVDVPEVGDDEVDGMLVVVEVPLTAPTGLVGGALQVSDFLAFEINALDQEQYNDGGCYTWLGVEFFEQLSTFGVVDIKHSEDNLSCAGADDCDCVPDDPDCPDCNGNGIRDDCDIADCAPGDPACQDCNGNEIPDECDLCDPENFGACCLGIEGQVLGGEDPICVEVFQGVCDELGGFFVAGEVCGPDACPLALGDGGDCCAPHDSPGCIDSECESAVCGADPFCCSTTWDCLCVAQAAELCGDLCTIAICGDPCGGNCCLPGETPGCEDEACCGMVCDIDPFCCDVSWDGICAGEAVEICTLCAGTNLQVILGPPFLIRSVGDDHTVTAVATDSGAPLAGVNLTFSVLSGPNAGLGGVSTTNVNGEAAYTYSGVGGIGLDQLQACLEPGGGGASLGGGGQVCSNIVEVLWLEEGCSQDSNGDGVPDECQGGCCTAGICDLREPQTCADEGGNYLGDGVTCAGVCCDPGPSPDFCLAAQALEVPSSVAGSTINATFDETDFCGTTNSTNGVWYSVLGTGHTLTATTCNGCIDYDTKITVFCNGCDTLSCVGGNDDSTCPGMGIEPSRVMWCSEPDVEYLILVHGFGQSEGDFRLDILEGELCEEPSFCSPQGIQVLEPPALAVNLEIPSVLDADSPVLLLSVTAPEGVDLSTLDLTSVRLSRVDGNGGEVAPQRGTGNMLFAADGRLQVIFSLPEVVTRLKLRYEDGVTLTLTGRLADGTRMTALGSTTLP